MHSWRVNNKVSDAALDLILRLLHPNPAKRLTPAEALLHPWLLSCPLTPAAQFAFPVGVPVPAPAASSSSAVQPAAASAAAAADKAKQPAPQQYGAAPAGSPVAMDTSSDDE